MTWVIIVVIAAAVATAVVVIVSKRRSRDGVDSFRRQIDALSPEARRPVVDQVQSVAESHDPGTSEAEAPPDPEDAGDTDDDS